MDRALFIGRFQPFHNAHLEDIKSILKKHKEILIGIGSSQEKNTRENPFSYNERKKMIAAVLKSNKIKNYKIYPVPDLYNDIKWVGYIKKNLPKFDVAYTGNSWTLKCFKKHSIKTGKIKLRKGISSTMIREKIAKGKKWQAPVPKEIAEHIRKIKGIERIRKIYSIRTSP